MTQCEIDFDGATYEPEFDRSRLNAQQRRVFDVMLDGRWRALNEISAVTSDPEASVSARLRDFRKFGFTVDRQRRGEATRGLFEYRLKLAA